MRQTSQTRNPLRCRSSWENLSERVGRGLRTERSIARRRNLFHLAWRVICWPQRRQATAVSRPANNGAAPRDRPPRRARGGKGLLTLTPYKGRCAIVGIRARGKRQRAHRARGRDRTWPQGVAVPKNPRRAGINTCRRPARAREYDAASPSLSPHLPDHPTSRAAADPPTIAPAQPIIGICSSHSRPEGSCPSGRRRSGISHDHSVSSRAPQSLAQLIAHEKHQWYRRGRSDSEFRNGRQRDPPSPPSRGTSRT